MKKIITLLLTVCMLVSLTACTNSATKNGGTSNTTSDNTTKASETTNAATTSESTTNDTEAATTTEQLSNTEAGNEEAKTLVVYFSCTGNTKRVAEIVAEELNADIYEIQPENPYSEADLNYEDDSSRGNQEMDDPSVRPAIVGSVENMEQYDTIVLGFPIWWGEAPRIVDTFVESYDFTDKTIASFCTSIGSGMGSSVEILEDLAKAGTWLEGKRFVENEADSEILNWVNQLSIN